jgi:hypothetical protein
MKPVLPLFLTFGSIYNFAPQIELIYNILPWGGQGFGIPFFY